MQPGLIEDPIYVRVVLLNNICVAQRLRSLRFTQFLPEVHFSPGLVSLQSNYMAVHVLALKL